MFKFLKNIFQKKVGFTDESGHTEVFRLPQKFPDDFSIELRRGNGRRLGGSIISLTASESYYLITHDSNEYSKCSFTISIKEMEDLFKKFKEFGFDKVEMEEVMRLDYPSTTLTVRWGKHFMGQQISQVFALKENSSGDFYACVGLVENTAATHCDKHTWPVVVVPDDNLKKRDSGFTIHFKKDHFINGLPWYESSSGKPIEDLYLMEGRYIFKLYMHNHDSSFLKPSIRFSKFVSLEVKKNIISTLFISANESMFLCDIKEVPQNIHS